jgi:hypothetical protein
MNYFDDEEDEDFLDNELTTKKAEMEREEIARKEFASNCNAAYKVISTDPSTIEVVKEENLINALNRMAAFFIVTEEFEKCERIKNFLEEKVPGEKLNPSLEEVQKFLGQ